MLHNNTWDIQKKNAYYNCSVGIGVNYNRLSGTNVNINKVIWFSTDLVVFYNILHT